MVTFLKPEVEYGTFYVGETTEGTVILPYDIFETKSKNYASQRWQEQIGWFGRLSDWTNWAGPFDSEAEAKECLSDPYDGDPVEDDIE